MRFECVKFRSNHLRFFLCDTLLLVVMVVVMELLRNAGIKLIISALYVVFKEMWRINLLQLPFFSLSHMSM
jgi:hypothetical protein